MASIKSLKSAKKFGIGYFIKEEMKARAWVQAELADVLGISTKHLNSILQNKQPLSIENAQKLSIAFGTSPQLWLNIDNNYRLWLLQQKVEKINDIESKSMIYSCMPIRDMMKKGWIGSTINTEVLKEEVKTYWGIDNLDFSFLEENTSPYYKKSEAYNKFNASYAATWYHKAKMVSESYKVGKYKKDELKKLYKNIASFTNNDNGIAQFLKELNHCGIKFFILPHLEKTYIDGAAFFHHKNPVIVYTSRYQRIDNFWFTIAHEIAHILKHINKNTPFILDNLKEESLDKIEIEANRMASEQLKHNEIIIAAEPYLNYLGKAKLLEISQTLNIHPAVVVGVLSFNKSLSYRNLKLFNDNVLELIPNEYLHESIKHLS